MYLSLATKTFVALKVRHTFEAQVRFRGGPLRADDFQLRLLHLF